MSRISWSKRPALIVVAALIAAACSSDKKSSSSTDAGVDAGPVCGDKKIEGKEECDTTVAASVTCSSETAGAKPVGSVTCVACKLVLTGCTASAGGGGGTGGGGTGGAKGKDAGPDAMADGSIDSGSGGTGGTGGTDAGKDSGHPAP